MPRVHTINGPPLGAAPDTVTIPLAVLGIAVLVGFFFWWAPKHGHKRD